MVGTMLLQQRLEGEEQDRQWEGRREQMWGGSPLSQAMAEESICTTAAGKAIWSQEEAAEGDRALPVPCRRSSPWMLEQR